MALQERITISLRQDGELEIFLNEAGRDKLVKELQRLDHRSEHFHLSTEDYAEVHLQSIAYDRGNQIIDAAKVLLRPDEWDRRYYPHLFD
jgi:hypothetical protein